MKRFRLTHNQWVALTILAVWLLIWPWTVFTFWYDFVWEETR